MRPRAALDRAAQIDVDMHRGAVHAHALEPDIGIFGDAVAQHPAAFGEPGGLGEFAHHRMIDAGHDEPAGLDAGEEALIGVVHRLDRAVIVEMLGVDIGDDADIGRQLDEGARRIRRPRR